MVPIRLEDLWISVVIVLVIFFCLYGVPAIIASIRLKKCGMSFRMQFQWHWERLVGNADWSYGIRTFWIKLKLKMQENYVPKDEFDNSLSMDLSIMHKLNDEDTEKYLSSLTRRRQLAHDLDMARDDAEFMERVKRERSNK